MPMTQEQAMIVRFFINEVGARPGELHYNAEMISEMIEELKTAVREKNAEEAKRWLNQLAYYSIWDGLRRTHLIDDILYNLELKFSDVQSK